MPVDLSTIVPILALLIPQDYSSCSEYFVNDENSKDSTCCAKIYVLFMKI